VSNGAPAVYSVHPKTFEVNPIIDNFLGQGVLTVDDLTWVKPNTSQRTHVLCNSESNASFSLLSVFPSRVSAASALPFFLMPCSVSPRKFNLSTGSFPALTLSRPTASVPTPPGVTFMSPARPLRSTSAAAPQTASALQSSTPSNWTQTVCLLAKDF
jgi:hypothetical protein